ncbi:MAG TPA: hypothetical protein VL460_04225 [Caulobacteraceae bacterium]|nr:hypothetical protein [Caulobacteraceae bacterium]
MSLTTGAQSQNEGNPGGAGASYTYTMTRDAGETGFTSYHIEIFNTDASFSDDFVGGGDQTFTWAGGTLTTTFTVTANPDGVAESNESPIIWFVKGAVGSGGAYLTSSQDISTNIPTLVNDDTGPPVFSTPAAISVAENLQAVTTIAASSGGTTMVYTLTGGADLALFNINGATGALTFVAGGGRDFETPGDAGGDNVYDVKVTATGGGVATEQAFAVTVTNANEAPVITSNGGGAAAVGVGPIAENTLTVIAANTATDVDAGDTRTWSISGGADASQFVINAQTGALSFAANPNFEAHADAGANDVFDVTIRATDAGGLFDDQTVSFTLTDADDPAVISSYSGADLLFLHASENTPTATTLATVVAADDDAGSTITWSTVGPDAARFTAVGGVLKFAASPDFEAPSDANGDNVFDVSVRATPTSGAADDQRFLVFLDNVVETGESGGSGGFTPPTPPTPTPSPTPVPTPTPTNTGNDSIDGTPGGDTALGGDGNDTIDGGPGADSMDGDNGNDSLAGGDDGDFIRGLADNDTVDGGGGADTVNGNVGDDIVTGGEGNDVVYGGQGADTVDGGDGDDSYVNGNIGNDIVHGGAGNDSVYGGQNDDVIYGDAGDDRLSGDLGNDVMYGGAGADRFTIAVGGGSDWVGDFNGAEGDRILLAPGTSYTLSTYQNQVVITLAGGTTLGLAGVAAIDSSWIVFGN